jgi:glycosyltransferase involved in cell wall biosynthesis
MRIGLLVLAAGKGAGGPETYEVELARALSQVDSNNYYRVYCTSPEAARAIGIERPNMTCHVLGPRSRWISVPLSLPLALLRDRIDLLHATYAPPPITLRPLVFTHQDDSPFEHPEYFDRVVLARLRPLLRAGLAKANHVICPSEFTRRATLERFGMPLDRITVIHNGVNDRFRPIDKASGQSLLSKAYGIEPPYFLYVGKLQRSKNITRLLEAYARVQQLLPDGPRLVLAGKRTTAADDLDLTIARLKLGGRVHELGHVCDEDLPSLYSCARAMVSPSFYEGFGLTVLEAMACGTPVIVSKVASLPEVAGENALLVDPFSVDAIAEAMLEVATDDALAERLAALGRKRSLQFSWPECARRTLAVYRAVHEKSKRSR